MDKKQLEHFKELLIEHKTKILHGEVFNSNEDLTVSSDDLSEEGDLASTVVNQQVSFNLRHREIMKLKAIDEALHRIEVSTYGECEECGEDIGLKRLENTPWTTLCITHAEEQEREQQFFTKSA